MLKVFFSVVFVLCAIPASKAQTSPQKGANDYDFVPREKVIFEDDFSTDTVGKFPAKWHLLEFKGSSKRMCTVRKDNEGSNIEILNNAQPDIEPIIKNGNSLSDSFTIEYDFLIESPSADANIHLISSTISPTYALGCWIDGNGNISVLGPCMQKHEQKSQYPGSFDLKVWHHFAVSYEKREIRYYVDHYRMFKLQDCDLSHSNFITNPRGPMKIRNVSIAIGNVSKPFDKLLTEKKFITHAINFDVNKSTIQPQSMSYIMQLAQFLKANPSIRLEIDGHTDSDGDAAANMKLSQQRADEVKKQLVSAGIDAKRLTVKGFGASKPLQPDTSPEEKANNRRVEFIRQ